MYAYNLETWLDHFDANKVAIFWGVAFSVFFFFFCARIQLATLRFMKLYKDAVLDLLLARV